MQKQETVIKTDAEEDAVKVLVNIAGKTNKR